MRKSQNIGLDDINGKEDELILKTLQITECF